MKQYKLPIIISSIITVFVIVGIMVLTIAHTNNRVVVLEESVNTTKSDISKEEQRRVDLFNNLADSVKSYDKHEAETLKAVTEARKDLEDGKTSAAMEKLSVVVEQYPDLKAQSNYEQINKEFSVTENRLANYRGAYNDSVKSYNRYVRSFFPRIILDMTGYENQQYNYLDYNVKNEDARNLFDD